MALPQGKIKGVDIKLEGKKLVMTVADVTKFHGVSKSGKTNTIATTGGNIDVGGGVIVGLNVYKKI